MPTTRGTGSGPSRARNASSCLEVVDRLRLGPHGARLHLGVEPVDLPGRVGRAGDRRDADAEGGGLADRVPGRVHARFIPATIRTRPIASTSKTAVALT